MSKVVGLFKQGLHEVPHLVLGPIFFFGTGVGIYFVTKRHKKYNRSTRLWKRRYTVVREEDFDPSKQIQPIDQRDPFF